eukprot:scaffold266_cov248-Pinguiococcus_pyrenoidosus.AAC.19
MLATKHASQARELGLAELLGSLGGRHHRIHHGASEAALLQRMNPGNGGAAGGSHLVLELARMLPGLHEHRRGAVHRLGSEGERHVPRKASANAAVGQRFDEVEHEGRSRAAHAGHSMQEAFLDFQDQSHGAEERFDQLLVLRQGCRAHGVGSGPLPHHGRRVGDHPHDAHVLAKVRLEHRDWHSARNGDDALVLCHVRRDVPQHHRNDVRLHGDHDGVRLPRDLRVAVLEDLRFGHLPLQHLFRLLRDDGHAELIGAQNARGDRSFGQSSGHVAGAQEAQDAADGALGAHGHPRCTHRSRARDQSQLSEHHKMSRAEHRSSRAV